MDDSRLASLSLGEIASMLSPKQQEVLLASISVAARFIQQIQAEEQQLQSEESRFHAEEDIPYDDDDDNLQAEQSYDSSSTSYTETPLHLSKSHSPTEISHSRTHHRKSSHSSSSYNNDTPVQADEKDLITIRQFAEELKQRRKSIRLSQKCAAQSLRAFTGGDQPCTDAIIYHFENLQLEPERAMQLIPLLRDWLDWAEKHRLGGKQLPKMSAVTKVPRERKRKVVLFNEKAKQYLEDEFMKNNHPDRYKLDVISQELNIPTRSIRKWFTNRRQRKRFAEKFSASLL